MSQSDSGGAVFGTNRGKIVEVAQITTQEHVQNRKVKQIVEVVHSIPMEVENAQMERLRGRVVEPIIDVQKPQVMEKIVKVPKITEQVEDTRYRPICSWRTSEQVASTRVQPTVNPVQVKQPKIFKMRKHSLREERSQVNSTSKMQWRSGSSR